MARFKYIKVKVVCQAGLDVSSNLQSLESRPILRVQLWMKVLKEAHWDLWPGGTFCLAQADVVGYKEDMYLSERI